MSYSLAFLLGIVLAKDLKAQVWAYEVISDDFTDEVSYVAYSYDKDYRYNDDFYVYFVCPSNKRLRFSIDAQTYVAEKGGQFKLMFRVDNADTRKITMNVYSNSTNGGYITEGAREIAREFMDGEKVRLRAVTWDNEYLDAEISISDTLKGIEDGLKLFNQHQRGIGTAKRTIGKVMEKCN